MILHDDTSTRSLLAIDGHRKTRLELLGECPGRLSLEIDGTPWVHREAWVDSIPQANIIAFAEGWPKVSVR